MIRAFARWLIRRSSSVAFTGLLAASSLAYGQNGGFSPPPFPTQPAVAAPQIQPKDQAQASPFGNAQALTPQQQKVQKLLAIHRALSDAQDLLRRGQHVDAVTVLERELGQIEGDREYLRTLQDAYHGAIQDLARSGNAVEADVYLKRLAALQSPSMPGPLSTPGQASHLQLAGATETSRPNYLNQPGGMAAPSNQVNQGPILQASGNAHGLENKGLEIVARGNLDDDPFAPGNFVKPQQTQLASAGAKGAGAATLKEADRAFQAGQFAQASKLFEKANTEGAKVEGLDRERWGYCKLTSLVDSFNQGQVHEAMIVEVDQAMALSPRLGDMGNRVRSQVIASLSDTGRNRSPGVSSGNSPGAMSGGSSGGARAPAAEIRRVQGTGNWQAIESAWFRVFYQSGEETAVEVARQADYAKAAASQKWLGHDGDPWAYRCDIWLYPTGEIYSKATGVPGSSPGHSTFKAEAGRVLERKIELRMDHSNLVDAVLPHEVTHVVLAGQFGKTFLPRWLDEGMAVLAEPKARIRRHTDHLPRYATEGSLLGSAQLMTLADYPEGNKVGIFYAQSVSTVDFLCSLRGTQAFTLFVKDAMNGDWEGALRKHYGSHGITGYDSLDRHWRGDWVALGK